jgi:hypothetical protein
MGSLTHASGTTPALHGALARSSPFTVKARLCVVCSRRCTTPMDMAAKYEDGWCLCALCWDAGWRAA